MQPVRRLMRELEAAPAGFTADDPAASSAAAYRSARGAGAGGRAAASAMQARTAQREPVQVTVGHVTAADIEAALAVTRPSAQQYQKQYAQWNERFGSH